MSRFFVVASVLGACASEAAAPSREQRVITALAEDNYLAGLRDPELVALKLRKMQRGPYEWLRGTAAVYWHDVLDPGGERPTTDFLDVPSSHVLLLGDPHPENIGTFRAADGTMLIDWNDFDAAGYGPYTADLRRLAAAMLVATDNTDLPHFVAAGYVDEIGRLAAGLPPSSLAAPLLDKLVAKATEKGDRGEPLDEIAPIVDGARTLALGDLEPVADDGVIEERHLAVDPETAALLEQAVAAWNHPELGSIALRARRVGAGISSYAALRYDVVLTGATPDPADDRVIEVKETRDGVIVHGIPQYATPEWPSPAARAVDTQRRLQLRRDADALLGSATFGGVSLKIRDRSAYQRGLDASDIADESPDEQRDLAILFGGLLARAHAGALTIDGVRGLGVIAPLLAGREIDFADEIATAATADAEQIVADHAAFADRDLAALVLP